MKERTKAYEFHFDRNRKTESCRFHTRMYCKEKRNFDADLDTADETSLPTRRRYCDSDLNCGIGVDEEEDYYNSWGVTDHYDSDSAIV